MGKSWIWKILSNHVRPHAVRPQQNDTNRRERIYAFRTSDMELSRTAGHASNYRSFRTSSQTGVGIPTVIETTFFYRWRLPRQCAHWLAKTGNSMVRGWSDALPPALVRGVSLRQRRDGGSTNFRKQSVNSIIFLCLPFLFFALFCEGYAGDALPPVPVCGLVPPPSQVRGARPCTASIPHTTVQTALQIPISRGAAPQLYTVNYPQSGGGIF